MFIYIVVFVVVYYGVDLFFIVFCVFSLSFDNYPGLSRPILPDSPPA